MVSNREIKQGFIDLDHRLEMIQTVLLVSNPDSPMAADAYNGLRRTVIQSLQASQVLLAVIAQLDSIAAATDDIDVVRAKLGEYMSQYGVSKIAQYGDRPDAFERIGQGPVYSVTKSAYVASPDMPPIQMGVAETTDTAPSAPSPTGTHQEVGPTAPTDGQEPTENDKEITSLGDSE